MQYREHIQGSHFWTVQYRDGSYDSENKLKKWYELDFANLSRFILMPQDERGTFLAIDVPRDSIIIFRKKRRQIYAINSGLIQELPILYYVGVEKGRSNEFERVECGLDDTSRIICNSGFRYIFDGKYLSSGIGTCKRSNFKINNYKNDYILLEALK